MSKLNIDQKSIKDLFSDSKADFLIPDYQRPYAWGDKECQTLWDDIFAFAIPDNDYSKFNAATDEYFLGPIVTFKNSNEKQEIIDGQQRLTTLMLLLRAFYAKYTHMLDQQAVKTRELISRCIWKTDEFGNPDVTALKIDSEVATDNDKEEFLSILRTGEAKKTDKSAYAQNYRFFQEKISEFLDRFPGYFSYLPVRILNNCILLPIEAESQDTALRIFSTLNDRGKPLSDADIFKAQFYKFYASLGKKPDFIARWRELEALCEKIFHPISGTPMDEIFTRYMYYERAKLGIKLSTTEALRKFYERDAYSLLKTEQTFDNLECLATFWNDVYTQNPDRFSPDTLRRLFILNYAPNSMWTYALSVYFMVEKDANDQLEEDALNIFLDRMTAFVWSYALTNPGVNALRTPIYAEMVNMINHKEVTFNGFYFEEDKLRTIFDTYSFNNGRPITRSMLAWWAMYDKEQKMPSLETVFEIEHIYARKRQENEKSLSSDAKLESLGNKVLLESRINIRASDYRFSDKKQYYEGFITSKNVQKEPTCIHELHELIKTHNDFKEADIDARYIAIRDAFIKFVKANNLLKVDISAVMGK